MLTPVGWVAGTMAVGAFALSAISARENVRKRRYGAAALDLLGAWTGGIGIAAKGLGLAAKGTRYASYFQRAARRTDWMGLGVNQAQVTFESTRRRSGR